MKKRKNKLPEVVGKNPSLLSQIDINDIGSKTDPCFGKEYDLSTNECKQCGDSELCSIKTASKLGKTREELEKERGFLDIESRIDVVGVKKYMRSLIRKGDSKKEIIVKVMPKYAITKDEARKLYKDIKKD